ncbi:hypothetical protein ACIA8C_36200 [Nocardia sp. NPDC051321]|uniref:hypothetical protein n=1 Tax=Nocardia sp. NPDC051321 TaxID=3364323 RepID=UPI0037979C3C
MSVSTSSSRTDGVKVGYRPTCLYDGVDGGSIPASVDINLTGSGDAWLNLSITDARSVLASLPVVLAEHAAANGDPEMAAALVMMARLLRSLNNAAAVDVKAAA